MIKLTRHLLTQLSIENTGYHMGACHYKITEHFSIRNSNNKFFMVTNGQSFNTIKEVCFVSDLFTTQLRDIDVLQLEKEVKTAEEIAFDKILLFGNLSNSTQEQVFEAMQIYANKFKLQPADNTQISKAAVLGVLQYMCGYTDFPEKKEGQGSYYWRTILREKFEEIGVSFTNDEFSKAIPVQPANNDYAVKVLEDRISQLKSKFSIDEQQSIRIDAKIKELEHVIKLLLTNNN